jgi:diacylglycerol kinase (ATP)
MDEQKLPQQRILFIVNPISGTRHRSSRCSAIEDLIDKDKFRYKIIETEHAGQGHKLAKAALEEGVDVVVAVGGDGTVNEVASALVGSGVSFGIIPTGSGNGLARHLKIPVSLKRALKIINAGKTIPMDTATLNGKPFVNIAGVGFDAFVAKKFSRAPKRGFLSYAKISFSEYFTYKPRKYRMIIDGQEVIRRALLISFANSNQFGNNTSIDPSAELDDGFIDVCIVKKIPFGRMIMIPPMLFIPGFDKSRYVEVIKAKEVKLKRKRGKIVHLDGDPVKMGKEMEMKIIPLSLNVIVP